MDEFIGEMTHLLKIYHGESLRLTHRSICVYFALMQSGSLDHIFIVHSPRFLDQIVAATGTRPSHCLPAAAWASLFVNGTK